MTKVANILGILLNRNFENIPNEYVNLNRSWKKIINEAFSVKSYYKNTETMTTDKVIDHSRIIDIQHNILLVEVDHSGWTQLLQTRQSKILKIIKRDFKDIQVNSLAFVLSKEYEFKENIIKDIKLNSREEQTLIENETDDKYKNITDKNILESLKRLENTIKTR
ncbi:hypothetical protein FACS1894190_15850 [Spirochaetia bacterium]|nr:hypothetical protein FACS1894190_15850 [Spirochaetia bacterium]